MHQLGQLLVGHVQELIQIDTAIGEFSESTLLAYVLLRCSLKEGKSNYHHVKGVEAHRNLHLPCFVSLRTLKSEVYNEKKKKHQVDGKHNLRKFTSF